MWLWFQPPPIGSIPGFVRGALQEAGTAGGNKPSGEYCGANEENTGKQEHGDCGVVAEVFIAHVSTPSRSFSPGPAPGPPTTKV